MQARRVQRGKRRGLDCRTDTVLLFGIVSPSPPKRPDARTVRTYRALSAALVELMKTREFDAITVQDLLDRAGVGRATFYSHFRNKDDFLLTDLERMLAALETHFDHTAGQSRRVAPVAELFDHLAEARPFVEALERSGRIEVLLDIVSGHLARIIERRLRDLEVQPRELPLNAAARVFGAMATELAKWWLSRETAFSALDMDARFHELVWRGLGRPDTHSH
jgi:AcrR family transcriptional regulator